MAAFVLTDASVTVNAVDLSDHVKNVSITYEANAEDDTVMGDTTKSNIAGLIEWGMSIEFAQDHAAAKVDATLFPLIGAAAFTISVKHTSASVSATNPNFTGSCILTSYPPLSSTVGDFATVQADFASAGTLSRATS
jgi:hypothetical protein